MADRIKILLDMPTQAGNEAELEITENTIAADDWTVVPHDALAYSFGTAHEDVRNSTSMVVLRTGAGGTQVSAELHFLVLDPDPAPGDTGLAIIVNPPSGSPFQGTPVRWTVTEVD